MFKNLKIFINPLKIINLLHVTICSIFFVTTFAKQKINGRLLQIALIFSLTGNSWFLLSASSSSLVRQAGFDRNVWRKSSIMQLWVGRERVLIVLADNYKYASLTPHQAQQVVLPHADRMWEGKPSQTPASCYLTSIVLSCTLPDFFNTMHWPFGK